MMFNHTQCHKMSQCHKILLSHEYLEFQISSVWSLSNRESPLNFLSDVRALVYLFFEASSELVAKSWYMFFKASRE